MSAYFQTRQHWITQVSLPHLTRTRQKDHVAHTRSVFTSYAGLPQRVWPDDVSTISTDPGNQNLGLYVRSVCTGFGDGARLEYRSGKEPDREDLCELARAKRQIL